MSNASSKSTLQELVLLLAVKLSVQRSTFLSAESGANHEKQFTKIMRKRKREFSEVTGFPHFWLRRAANTAGRFHPLLPEEGRSSSGSEAHISHSAENFTAAESPRTKTPELSASFPQHEGSLLPKSG